MFSILAPLIRMYEASYVAQIMFERKSMNCQMVPVEEKRVRSISSTKTHIICIDYDINCAFVCLSFIFFHSYFVFYSFVACFRFFFV